MAANQVKPQELSRPTETLGPFRGDNGDEVYIKVWNTARLFAWALVVNDDEAVPTTHYSGIHSHRGWHVATNYWAGVFPEFIPFNVNQAKKGENRG